MLFTSYFTRCYLHPAAISISRWAPKEFAGPAYPDLAPSQELLLDYKKGLVDDVEYTRRFMTQLSTLDPHKVVADLPPQSILLCYEGSSLFCHRHIVAEWIESNTGVIVREIRSFDIDRFIATSLRMESI